MSRKDECYDNAVAESFFSTLEFELLQQNDWHTRDAARRAIFRYIETWYNPRRQRRASDSRVALERIGAGTLRHSTLGYLSPAAYEEQQREAA